MAFAGVVGLVSPLSLGATGAVFAGILTDAVYAVGVLVFAFGLTRRASVVDRGPLGVTALVVVALVPLSFGIAVSADAARAPALASGELVIGAAAATIGVVRIARAGVVPYPWRWAPLWALGAYAVGAVVPQLILVVVGTGVPAVIEAGLLVGTLGWLCATLGLGVCAFLAAAGVRPDAVEVYPAP